MVIHIDLTADDLLGDNLGNINDFLLDGLSGFTSVTFDVRLGFSDDLVSLFARFVEHDLITLVRTLDCLTDDLISFLICSSDLVFPAGLEIICLFTGFLGLLVLCLDLVFSLRLDLFHRLKEELF